MIAAGVDVVIEGPEGKSSLGRVETVVDVAELPRIQHMEGEAAALGYVDSADAVRRILFDRGVSRLALISYERLPGQRCAFTAFERGDGWFDLRDQRLTLTPISAFPVQ